MADDSIATRWLLVRINERRMAIPASLVRAVLPARKPTPLPLGTPGLSGITLFRGRVIPLVDPRPILGLAPGEQEGGGIVVMGLSGGFGILVSEVLGMVQAEAAGEIRWRRKLVDRLDPAELLRTGLIRLPSEQELKAAVLPADVQWEADLSCGSAGARITRDED